MGQKVNPTSLRLGINRTWDSRWYADKNDYGTMLHADLKIREYLKKRLAQAGVSRIIIERPAKKARITIHTARPGVVIGKKGADIETLRRELQKMTGSEVHLNIVEIRSSLRSGPGGSFYELRTGFADDFSRRGGFFGVEETDLDDDFCQRSPIMT